MIKKVINAHHHMESGDSLLTILSEFQILPDEYIAIISSGETSGKMGDAISLVLESIDNKIKNFISIIEKSIEPVFVIIVGLVVGIIVIKYFKSVYSFYS